MFYNFEYVLFENNKIMVPALRSTTTKEKLESNGEREVCLAFRPDNGLTMAHTRRPIVPVYPIKYSSPFIVVFLASQ